MRVGILTFHAGPNHGAFLQAASLLHCVRLEGHEVEVIDYVNPVRGKSQRLQPWLYRRPMRLVFDIRKRLAFQRDLQYLPRSPRTSSYARIDTSRYDAIICGSDVVWNFEIDGLGHDPVYAGIFPNVFNGKRIAYAPSVGSMQLEYKPPSDFLSGLRSFDVVSVRDAHSQEWLRRNCNLNAQIVVDPTWLAPARTLGRKCRGIGSGDMVIYATAVDKNIATAIVTYARSRHLRTVAVGYYHSWCDSYRPDIGPLTLPSVCNSARCIVSSTFHGTLFAIRENRPFVCLSTNDMLNKTSYWLSELGLMARFCQLPEDFAHIMDSSIKWSPINAYIDLNRNRSLSFLRDALSD